MTLPWCLASPTLEQEEFDNYKHSHHMDPSSV
ncbi:hypothetical protein FOVG_19551 [Fusarium oxysporum f. sp. pisi HDV247]|uniref:Uncharacterized protein n=1 Tax=Fusarium oxysporum f. sp. pisi HDV247 TaxID=1080344 RepID=W9NFY1_FUSOX|nr:hypothetical protein FOVG_19551 [Fusarium oxysporum f. sp. pisi HDV247]